MEKTKKMIVNVGVYDVIRLLGKGNSGYSYLVTDGRKQYVLKQIHHEPSDYHQDGDKLQAEIDAYERLSKIGIRIPEMYEYDRLHECILKEYIEGSTVLELVKEDRMKPIYRNQLEEMLKLLYPADTNIDYFPENFIVCDDILYYIDYECRDYNELWNFENWGSRYWSKTDEFMNL